MPILVVSTYDTNVILFKKDKKDAAVKALAAVADVSRLREIINTETQSPLRYP